MSRHFLKFATVGIVNTAVTFSVFNICTLAAHFPASAANAIGWTAGFANSFLMNRAWTFRDRQDLSVSAVLPRFALANLVAFAASECVVLILDANVSRAYGSAPGSTAVLNIIEALAIVCSLGVNYLISSRWAFNNRRPSQPRKPEA